VHLDEATSLGCGQAVKASCQRLPRDPQSGVEPCELDGDIQRLSRSYREGLELRVLTLQGGDLCHSMAERRNLAGLFDRGHLRHHFTTHRNDGCGSGTSRKSLEESWKAREPRSFAMKFPHGPVYVTCETSGLVYGYRIDSLASEVVV